MIFVVEDAVEVFDADICVVFKTVDFGLIVVIIIDDANNFVDDSVDVVLDVFDVRDFDFVDSIDAFVVMDEINEEISLVVNIDVVDISFSTCLKKKIVLFSSRSVMLHCFLINIYIYYLSIVLEILLKSTHQSLKRI